MLQEFIALFFPNYCFTCRQSLVRGEQYICTHCRTKLPKTNVHREKANPLINRYQGFLPIECFLPYLKFKKGGKVQKIMEQLKYEGCPEIGSMLGRWYGSDLADAGFSSYFDLIVPVPLHKSKLRKRGYNQSDYLAEGLFRLSFDTLEPKRVGKNYQKSFPN